MEELGDTVEKLHSMYDLERFITEQERLLKRVPELEEEVRRLKPREDQVAVCLSLSCLSLHVFLSPSPSLSPPNLVTTRSLFGKRERRKVHEPMAKRFVFFALAFQRRAKG